MSPTETLEDRAAQDFRSIVRNREERTRQRRTNRMMYAISASLVLIIIVMSVAMVNNFDKMRSVQLALNDLMQNSSETVVEDETVETGAEVTVVMDGTETTEDIDAEGAGTLAGQSENGETELTDGQAEDIEDYEVTDLDTESEQGDSNENGSDGVYIVEKGDTLAIISRKMYGDISHVDNICAMNGLENGNLIYIGQKLLLP